MGRCRQMNARNATSRRAQRRREGREDKDNAAQGFLDAQIQGTQINADECTQMDAEMQDREGHEEGAKGAKIKTMLLKVFWMPKFRERR